MEVLHERCAGLDVHKNTVVGCVRLAQGGRVEKEVKTFKTTTGELLALAEWLDGHRVNHVVMEATGVYWKPVWHILDDGERQLVLANAAHVKNVPGRKSDVSDCDWLSDLEAHGLIRPSFVPDGPTQELRGLLRTRKQLVRERTSHTLRLQKTLEDANIKLDSVISNVVGVSGRRMIEALMEGQSDPAVLAALADRRIKAPPEVLCEALRGRVTRHHRFLLGLHLGIDMRETWTCDDALLDQLRDREVLDGILTEVAGEEAAAANREATGKVKRQIVRDCLTGENGRAKVEGWVPRWMAFPPTAYTERGGVPTVERSAMLADLVASLAPQPSPLAQAA